jgi:hypothetical protein
MTKKRGSRAQWVYCCGCDHVWIGLYWPQPISVAIKQMKHLCCPVCGTGAKLIKPIDPPKKTA